MIFFSRLPKKAGPFQRACRSESGVPGHAGPVPAVDHPTRPRIRDMQTQYQPTYPTRPRIRDPLIQYE